MIATTSPLTRHIRLLVAVLVIAALAIATQGVSAEPAHAKTKRTYVIDGPIGKGLLVKPSELSEGPDREYDGTIGFKDLIWTSWEQPTASAEGIWFWKFTGDRIPVTVTLSKVKRCGPYRLYTLMQVEYHSEPGTPTALPDREMIYRINKRCVLTLPDSVLDTQASQSDGFAAPRPQHFYGTHLELGSLLWSRWRANGAVAKGYVEPHDWWGRNADGGLPLDKLRDYAALAKASRPRYCRRSGTISYTRIKITAYGNGILNSTSTRAKHNRLRSQVGKGKRRHLNAGKSISRWCKLPYNPIAGWTPGTS